MILFDRDLVCRHRDRAAPRLAGFDFLLQEIGQRLAERLEFIQRQFPTTLDLGCHGGHMAKFLMDRSGIETIIQADLSRPMATLASMNGQPTIVCDEEFLPFAPNCLDLVVSCLSLHWVNDLPGALLQIRQSLRPDGLFIAAMLGGDTLIELRRALMEVELEIQGGVSPRVSPMVDLRDVAGLLQRAGFALPVADSDNLTVEYPHALRLMGDLRGMGQGNAVKARATRPVGRDFFARVAARYAELYALPDGRIPATFQVLYLAGWAPAESQPKPIRRGSATSRLADALGGVEIGTGVKVTE